MTDRVRFHFDPLCPWCYQTSRWIRRVAELGEVELSWGLFSLELQNSDDEHARLAEAATRAGLALSTAVAVRDVAGPGGVGDFYAALGRRVHEDGEAIEDAATVKSALGDARLDPGLADRAGADAAFADRAGAEHAALVDRTRSFGVPTIVLDDGEGPAIFGPVIVEPPTDDAETVELWRHVAWLARSDNFAELKRDRDRAPDLESVRRHQR